MSMMTNKHYWKAHNKLIGFSSNDTTFTYTKLWSLRILKRRKNDKNFSNYFTPLNMYEFIWFEFILNFYSKFIFNYSKNNYTYCNEYLKYTYEISYPPFLIQFSRETNGIFASDCSILLDDYARKDSEFENKSIEEIDLLVKHSIDFLNYLNQLVYPSVPFTTVFKNNIENAEVQKEFNITTSKLGKEFYNRFKNKLYEMY